MRRTVRSQQNVKVHLTSKDVLTIAGLQQLLAPCPFISITGTSTNEATTMTALKADSPHVLVLNASTELEALTVAQAARGINESLKVVVLTDEATAVQLMSTSQVRIEGILVRGDDCLQDIGAVLRIVHQGGGVTSSYDKARLVTRPQSISSKVVEGLRSLSPREAVVLRELARGHTNAEIATPLHVSVATIKADIARIMSTMEASSRVNLAVLAVQGGFITEVTQTQDDNTSDRPVRRSGKRKPAADD